MKKFSRLSFIAASALSFCAMSARATILEPMTCVGANTSACPGTIDYFGGNPGQLLATSSIGVYNTYYPNPNDLSHGPVTELVGNIVSSVYREQPDVDGHFANRTFYYQYKALDGQPQPIDWLDIIPHYTTGLPILPAEIGMRLQPTDLPGFNPSNAPIHSIEMTNTGAFLVHFDGTPIEAGQSSAILEIKSQYQYYQTAGFGGVDTVRDANGNATGYGSNGTDMGLLVPANVPEPASFALAGVALAALGLGRKLWRA